MSYDLTPEQHFEMAKIRLTLQRTDDPATLRGIAEEAFTQCFKQQNAARSLLENKLGIRNA